MTFVAQPYEQFVDDLLTALTGGMIREEHRFVGSEESYSLAAPGVIALSIKVFGQRNEAFFFFEGGRDYRFDPEEETIEWIAQGQIPDDHSFFYINYYVAESHRRLTDRNPGSVTSILSEAFARELSVLHKQMEMIYQSAFVDWATGTSLDHVAALLGVTRKDAKYATGEVLFKRSTPAEGDITIPVGTLVSTKEGQNFETSAKRTLRRGQLSIAVPIRAQIAGSPGRVESNAVININRPIFGIKAVVNERPTFFANEKETDDALRLRIKGTLERAGRATVNAIKFGLIEAIPEINEGNIQVTERADVAGMVEVKLGLETSADAQQVQRIEEAIFHARPAGVRVLHNLPSIGTDNTVAGVEMQAGALGPRDKSPLNQVPAEALAHIPEGMLPLKTDIALRLSEPNLSATQKEKVIDDVRSSVVTYIDHLTMGAPLIYNKLLGRIMANDDVADARLTVNVLSAGNDGFTENLDTAGRKATIDPQHIDVGLMEELVLITIRVLLEPTPGLSAPPTVSRALKDALGDAIHREFAASPSSLELERLKNLLQSELSAEGSFQLAIENPVSLNAEYEETGCLMNNTSSVDLSGSQVPRLQQLDIVVSGDLDV